MKHFTILLVLTFLISGCSRKAPVSQDIANNAINTATTIENNLPVECKTEPIMSQLSDIKTQIRSITKACETEKDAISAEKKRWQWAFYGSVIIIGLFFAKKVLK